MRKLTPKQRRFVDEYLIDLNASAAAKRAGYSEKTAGQIGHELLKKPEIAEGIDKARLAQGQRTGIDADYVLQTIRSTVERCRQAEPVFDKRGDPVLTKTPEGGLAQAYTFESASVLKGCELLGRNLALWKDRVEHTGKDGGPIQTEEISDAERARRIAFVLSKGVKDTVQ